MAKQVINRGTLANDGTGESPFTGMGKVNDNFTELYNKDVSLDIDVSQRLKVSDGEKDFILTGLSTPVPSPASATGIMSAGNGYVNGTRVEKLTTTSYTYAASSDTYNDIDNAGTITRVVVANGGTPAAVVAGRVRLEKVVTNATPIITSVTRLAPDRSMLLGTRDSAGNVNGLADPSGVNAYGFAVFPKDADGYAVGNLIPRQNTLTNLLATAGGNGEISKATDWHALVRHTGVANAAKVLYAERKRAGAQAFVGQSIPSGTATALSFGSTLATADSTLWNSANPTRFLVPSGANRCRCTARVKFAANATGSRKLSVMNASGSTLFDLSQASAHGTLPTEILVSSQVFDPSATAYLELKALQDSGAALSTDSVPFTICEFEFWVE